MNRKIARFLAENRPATPCLVFDLASVEQKYREIEKAMPETRIYYAVKANPAPDILKLLVKLGSCFDVASVPEVELCLAAGAKPENLSYGNTIKKERDIATAYERGVRLYAFDSEAELEKIARAAPGARVFCRLLAGSEGAEWPLSRKFGCDYAMARDLMLKAPKLGLVPFGLSFHVGSQQTNPTRWDQAVAETAKLFRELEGLGVELRMVNLGGGLPARYRKRVPTIAKYVEEMRAALRRHFGNRAPEHLIMEPGRGMVGDAGVVHSEVVLVSRKSAKDDKRWVYLDIGKFGGMAETMDEAIQYPIVTERDGAAAGPVILAGPTCDSVDIMYEKADYKLPLDLKSGDRVTFLSAGAYTSTYASVGFNGFAPLKEYYI
ncbi:MAG: type III PLP-dependent enzyme [Alphaproteobacteria bacterium]|nr:type III PLP-dependent enzyme [Alphaproteobacteria bacterium]